MAQVRNATAIKACENAVENSLSCTYEGPTFALDLRKARFFLAERGVHSENFMPDLCLVFEIFSVPSWLCPHAVLQRVLGLSQEGVRRSTAKGRLIADALALQTVSTVGRVIANRRKRSAQHRCHTQAVPERTVSSLERRVQVPNRPRPGAPVGVVGAPSPSHLVVRSRARKWMRGRVERERRGRVLRVDGFASGVPFRIAQNGVKPASPRNAVTRTFGGGASWNRTSDLILIRDAL